MKFSVPSQGNPPQENPAFMPLRPLKLLTTSA
jgi:hypothetical protein